MSITLTTVKVKNAFYDGLYALDVEEDETPEEEVAVLLRMSRKRKMREVKVPVRGSLQELSPMEPRMSNSPLTVWMHTASEPIGPRISVSQSWVLRDKGPSPTSTLATSDINRSAIQSRLERSSPLIATDISAEIFNSIRPARGKKNSPLQTIAVSRQVFRMSIFHFIPNNDICPARRMRIRKVLEYGAIWAQVWRQDVSHIVVDDHVEYSDVLSHLGIKALPPTMVMVNALYPADCISFRYMIDASQSQYLPQGAPSTKYPELLKQSTGCEGRERKHSRHSDLPLKPDLTEFGRSKQTESSTQSSVAMVASSQSACEISPVVANPPKDSLQEVIQEARSLAELPWSDDEEDACRKATPKQHHFQLPDPITPMSDPSSPPSPFACQRRPLDPNHPNHSTILILQKMGDYYTTHKDHLRAIGYRRAVASLRSITTHRVTSYAEALRLPHVGDRLATKIEEIAHTSRLRRLDATMTDPTDKLLETFMGIYGVGLSEARKFVVAGYTSLEDVRRKASLTTNQKIGLAHYNDFAQRIARDEVAAHGTFARIEAMKVNPALRVQIMGSYRRGRETSGDIDLLISHPSYTLQALRAMLIKQLLPRLFQVGYLRATLSSPNLRSGEKWMGAATLPDLPALPDGESRPWRRLDILLVPKEEVGSAMLYFTGDEIFGRSLRLVAKKKGWRLNQRGLFIGGGNERVDGTEGAGEKELMEKLGLVWREPSERNCA